MIVHIQYIKYYDIQKKEGCFSQLTDNAIFDRKKYFFLKYVIVLRRGGGGVNN